MLLLVGCLVHGTAPTVSVRALYNAPPTSVASYLIQPRRVKLCAVVSWPECAGVAGWLLEASVRAEAVKGGPSTWEPAATLPADETTHLVNIEPGLAYSFRLAALSELDGQLPFSDATKPVSVLRRGSGTVRPAAVRLDASLAAAAPRAAAALVPPPELLPWDMPASTAAAPPPPPAEVLPWDAPAAPVSAAPAPSAPTPMGDLRSESWLVTDEQPLLNLVPTSAELALLQVT
jgi:hypothetical protein